MSIPGDVEARMRREAEYHDRWAREVDVSHVLVDEPFTAPTALENRHALERFGELRGKRLLDFGCGAGEAAVFFAKQGAQVVGMDVSTGMLDATRQLAAHHGVNVDTRVVEGASLPAADGEFDLIYGMGVLHHAPLDSTIPELARVMAPAGCGCFVEPLPYNPVINVYRRIAREVRTPDERPIRFRDVERFRASFGDVSHREFWLSALLVFMRFYLVERVDPNKERYWKKVITDAERLAPMFNPLARLDSMLLSRVPWLGHLCWNTVISVAAPRPSAATSAPASQR